MAKYGRQLKHGKRPFYLPKDLYFCLFSSKINKYKKLGPSTHYCFTTTLGN